MSVLSITAPQFTAEDERLEQETYTPEELEAARRDLYGIPNNDYNNHTIELVEDDDDDNDYDYDGGDGHHGEEEKEDHEQEQLNHQSTEFVSSNNNSNNNSNSCNNHENQSAKSSSVIEDSSLSIVGMMNHSGNISDLENDEDDFHEHEHEHEHDHEHDEDDMHLLLPAPPTSAEDLELLIQSFYQALEEYPMEEKEAYIEALEQVPPMVMDMESPAALFLQAEHYHPWAAAERCIQYWEFRKWLFGQDRAFLPMSSTGNGTLNADDVALLQTGFCTLLQDDDHGRGVVWFQAPAKKLQYDRMALVRVIFYVLTVALEKPNVQQHGLVLVADTKNYTTSRFDRKFIKCVAYLFTGYHPITTKAYHICAPPGKSCFLLVLPFIRYFMTRHVRQRFVLHRGTSSECAMDLNDYGIPTRHLPQFMGGDYTLTTFQEWLEQRRLLELERESNCIMVVVNDHEDDNDESHSDNDGEEEKDYVDDEDEDEHGPTELAGDYEMTSETFLSTRTEYTC